MTSESTDGKLRGFDHPFLQACGMFLGETMCMLAFFVIRWRRRRNQEPGAPPDPFTRPRNFSPLVFLPPALCDMTATSIQYIGLTLTYASSFQMLRGRHTSRCGLTLVGVDLPLFLPLYLVQTDPL